jgi:hypothetical protein
MTPIAANKTTPRLLNRHLPSLPAVTARRYPTWRKAPAAANIPAAA